MNIVIPDFNENEVISLLSKIIDVEQISKNRLLEENNLLKTKNEDLDEQIKTISKEKAKLEQVKTELEGQVQAAGEEKDKLEKAKTELEGQVQAAGEEKDKLEQEKTELEGQVKAVGEEKDKLEKANTKLESQYEALIVGSLYDKLKCIRLILDHAVNDLHNEKWIGFIRTIIESMPDSIQSCKSIDEAWSNMHIKNGCLSKLVSLWWWSMESHVRESVPVQLGANSDFSILFNDFLGFLENHGFKINLPSEDFSAEISHYKADYDERADWVKELFPQYQPEGFVLCEISFLSVNDSDGKCNGYRKQ